MRRTSHIRMRPSVGTPDIEAAAQLLTPLLIEAHERRFRHHEEHAHWTPKGRLRVRIAPHLAAAGG